MDMIDVGGVKLACEVVGQGQPILFVHGFPLSGRLWEAVIESMRHAYRLIIPDLRGMGESGVTEAATMGTYADDLSGLLDALGETRPVVLVGLSMGGYIAFEFYRRHPQRVRALVLADTRAEADTPEKGRERLEMAEHVHREGSGVVAEAMVPKLFGRKASAELREQWRQIITATDPIGVVAALRAMGARADSMSTLGDISVPTLIVVGEEDQLTPPAVARQMHAATPGAQLKIIPDAGHMTPVERPQAFVRVLRAFVDGVPT